MGTTFLQSGQAQVQGETVESDSIFWSQHWGQVGDTCINSGQTTEQSELISLVFSLKIIKFHLQLNYSANNNSYKTHF